MNHLKRFLPLKPLFALTPLVLFSTLSAGWTNPLRPLHEGMDPATLAAESRHMGDVFRVQTQANQSDSIRLDLADEAQFRFMMNRLLAAGKTPKNSPYLFERLRLNRQQALARGSGRGGEVTPTNTAAWGCDHFLMLQGGATNLASRQYASNPVGSCLGGANYIYEDVVAFSSNLAGTQSTVVASSAGEEYGGGTNFNSVKVSPSLAITNDKKVVVDSMMIAMNDNTGEEVITYTKMETALSAVDTSITIANPRSPGAPTSTISVCQLRGGSDCDYAVVDNSLAPYVSTPTGVALRKTAAPWTGEPTQFFSLPGTFNPEKIYLPLEFTFDAGSSDSSACSITSFGANTKVRLIKTLGGGTCLVTANLQNALNGFIGQRTANFRRLLDFSYETTTPGFPGTDCSMQKILNDRVELSMSISAQANCGNGVVPRNRTLRSIEDLGWSLQYWNSCMAEGTPIVRADGTTAAIEELKAGDKVRANDKGLVLTVTDVSSGREDKPLVQLRDDLGHQVRLTEKHPVVLASGQIVFAADVKAKQRVRTDRGLATILSTERIPYEGQVFNLTLGTAEELAKVNKRERTMFAGGFLVGDNAMQRDLETPRQIAADVLKRLPKVWHKDYRNQLARK